MTMATKKKWSAKVDTESTYPENGLFTKSPTVIAKSLASKKVSPKGPASGMRMLNFYINRAGKNLSPSRHEALEKAKTILSEMIRKQKESSSHTSVKTEKRTSTRSRHAA
jgi:tRNA(adenine34) deaminase